MSVDAASTPNPSPAIKASWIVGLLGGFLIFLLIVTYSSRMARDADSSSYDEQRRTERLDILKKQRAADDEALTTADWVDAKKGTVRIPIDEAIPQTIALLKTKPVREAAEIPGSSMPPVQQAVPATASPAPTATNAAPPAPPAPAAPNK